MDEMIIVKVAEALQSDVGHGRARIDTNTRTELGLEPGDIVEIKGKKITAAKVFRVLQEDENKGIIRADGLVRKNAGVSIGEKVEIRKIEMEDATEIVIAPLISESHRLKFGAGIETFVKRGLLKRPLTMGDTIIVPGIALMGGSLPFLVVSAKPTGIVQIIESTEVIVKDEPVKEGEMISAGVTYEDIGGLKEELLRVREMIELPLKHPELFDRLGIDPPKGVLLYGPPGTGKTLIAKAVASEAGANFFSIQGPEIMSKYYGQSEEKLREIFKKAEEEAPSVIFLDEFDSIAPKRDEVQGEVERRVVAQLLTLMDGLAGRGNTIVIAATNRVDAIDPALRRPGRFDREIYIGVPDRDGRKVVLQIHTRGMPVDDDFDIEYLASITHGFVGADLAALAREAAMKSLRRYLPEIDLEKPIPPEVLEKMKVTETDFRNALKEIEPSSLREVLIEIPNVSWDDVGGLEDIKEKLKESVELPLTNPELFSNLGIKPPSGVLLYGPPGTGKTLLAKAIANETNANFISIKGSEIMSKWVGESEKAVREIFKKAKQVSPCIVFLDEIDAIAPARGTGNGDSNVTERIVNQLLTSIDGLESLENVITLAATNRPDIVDSALLRPGRFDRHLHIPAPDEHTRLKILQVHTARMPLHEDVTLASIANETIGFSGADLRALCREAGMVLIRSKDSDNLIKMRHFQAALDLVHPSITEAVVKYYDDIGKQLERGRMRKAKEKDTVGTAYI